MYNRILECRQLERLKARLELSNYEAVGVIQALWIYTAEEAPSGLLAPPITTEKIEKGIGWDGKSSFLMRSFIWSGFLIRPERKRFLIVTGWHTVAPEKLKRRYRRNGWTFASQQYMDLDQMNRKLRIDMEGNEIKSEMPKASDLLAEKASEVFCTIPTKGKKLFDVEEMKVREYQGTYQNIDVRSEIKKARQWIIDNPGRMKTPRGMPRFLNSWLSRASDKRPQAGVKRESYERRIPQRNISFD